MCFRLRPTPVMPSLRIWTAGFVTAWHLPAATGSRYKVAARLSPHRDRRVRQRGRRCTQSHLDVPVATYYVSRPGGQLAPSVRCEEIGYKVPFDWARLEALYGSSRNHAAKVAELVDRLVLAPKSLWSGESTCMDV